MTGALKIYSNRTQTDSLAKALVQLHIKVFLSYFFPLSMIIVERNFESAGKLLLNGMEVAMKFTPYNKRSSAEREYKIYTYLNAIDNRTIEWYGIPSIHYYGRWNNFIMMAMNLFDSEFHKRTKRGTITELDLLILFQEFVSWKFYSGNGFLFS